MKRDFAGRLTSSCDKWFDFSEFREHQARTYFWFDYKENVFEVPEGYNGSEIDNEILRYLFFCRSFHRYSTEKRMIHGADLFRGPFLREGFNEELKKQRASLVQRSLNGDTTVLSRDLVPLQGLLRVNEEVDDYKYALVPAQVEDDIQELFIEELNLFLDELIGKEVLLPKETEFFLCPKDSKTLRADGMKTVPQFEESLDQPYTTVFVAKRSVVKVYPTGVRDTVIADPRSLRTARLIDETFRHLLDFMPESGLVWRRKSDRNYQRIFFGPLAERYFQRDIQKCGLTFPIQALLDLTEETLRRRIPCDAWGYLSIFRNLNIRDDKLGWLEYKRGYCLGFANAVATFFLVLAHRLAERRLHEQRPDLEFERVSLIYNDDAVDAFFGPDGLEAEQAWEGVLDDTLTSLGILTKPEKSFSSCYPEFCQQVRNPELVDKSIRNIMFFAQAKFIRCVP